MGTLLNGLKDIFSTSKTTATHLPVCASDGTPQGRISAADLASVLGGLVQRGSATPLGDFNAITLQGLYTCSTTFMTHKPDGLSGTEGFLAHLVYSSAQKMQYLFEGGSVGHIYYRKWTTSQEWSDWHFLEADIPTFYKNYSDLNSLATALGGLQYNGKLNGDIDLDSTVLRQQGVWTLDSLSGTAFTTLGFQYGEFVSIGNDYGVQIAAELAWDGYSSNKMFLRIKWGKQLSPWRKVIFTA